MPETKRLLSSIVVVLTLPTMALGAWNIVTNPTTSNPEATWSNKPAGQSTSDILYSYLDGSSWAPSTTLTHLGANTSCPSIAISGAGKRALVWESSESTASIQLSSLPASGGTWSAPVAISDTSESSRAPSAAILSSDVWASYEVVPASGGRLVKVAKTDPGGGVARTLIRATASTSALKVKIHSENGHLWVDWVDSPSVLGWSEYVGGNWTSMSAVYYDEENETNIQGARNAARTTVLGL